MTVNLIVGALGLFLLGMWLMTEGMKLAGGRALKHLLGSWTSTRLRGLITGVVVTAMVNSSSAVTVAVIGFINARLMSFSRSTWVVFGSNVGTTFTAWLVTILGLKMDIGGATFLFIGAGAFLRVFSPYERGRALGMALAGFGILFMGIDALQDGFAGLAASNRFVALLDGNGDMVLVGVLAGLLLTVLTQSSIGSLVVIFSAVGNGIMAMDMAAAAVIGANIGTTSTSLIATIGATVNARRLALVHVLFNVATGVVALILLPSFLWLTAVLGDSDSWFHDRVLQLCTFHTLFNVLGVLLMWPLEPAMTRFLLNRYRREEGEATTRYLDRNVASIPDLALKALSMELHKLADTLACLRLEQLIVDPGVQNRLSDLDLVVTELDDYIDSVSRTSLTEGLAAQLAAGIALRHYLSNSLQLGQQVVALYRDPQLRGDWLKGQLRQWLSMVSDFCGEIYHQDEQQSRAHWQQRQEDYVALKNRLMSAGPVRQASLAEIDLALQVASFARRYVEQLLHTCHRFQLLDGEPGRGPGDFDGRPSEADPLQPVTVESADLER